jgi:hypothetical protein
LKEPKITYFKKSGKKTIHRPMMDCSLKEHCNQFACQTEKSTESSFLSMVTHIEGVVEHKEIALGT